ncbi:MAG: DsbC family protein [Gammaproteobacteria bacterium]|jgi:thiol:disulfide interchange protein DsbC
MRYFIRFASIVGAIVLAAGSVVTHAAAVSASSDLSATNEALNKLRANFIGLPVADFGPAPIKGLYEFVSNDTMLYYSPEQDLLLVGEIYSKDGHSLTAARLAALQGNTTDKLPLDKALKIGNGPKRIIEFTDPECPYCQAYNKYVSAREAQVTRYIFFFPLTNLHPTAAAKAVHILCARDPQAAFAKVYAREAIPTDLKDCAAGRTRLAEQEAVGRRLGIHSTPTLILGNGERVKGFDQAHIAKYLSKN